MQPHICFCCGFQGQTVVLQVVPSNQNLCSVCCRDRKRLLNFHWSAVATGLAKIPLLNQFLSQLFHICFCFCTGQRIQYAFQICQLCLALCNLFGQYRFCCASFLVLLIIPLCILRRCQANIQRNGHHRAIRLIEIFQFCNRIALFQAVEVGRQQICFPAEGIFFRTLRAFFCLGSNSSLNPFSCMQQQMEQVICTLPDTGISVTLRIEIVQYRTSRWNRLCNQQCAILMQWQEREIFQLPLFCCSNGKHTILLQ